MSNALTFFTGALAILSVGLLLWQWLEARRFPLHRRVGNASPSPGVTVLKPLKGVTRHTAACLRSWLDQEYAGPVQILFGVASKHDPVCQLVRDLASQYPLRDMRLVSATEPAGTNGKVSTLMQLESLIANELVVISDADVWAPPDFLSQITAQHQMEQAQLINCLYAMRPSSRMASRLEALAVNADFWPQVLQAGRLAPLDFALGAAMLTTRQWLHNIGGFRSLADCLADDFQLGQRITRAGGKIQLCPLIVECRSEELPWNEVWKHQLRWARTIRVSRPWPYFGSVLNNTTWWTLLFLIAGSAVPWTARLLAAGAICFLRVGAARETETRFTKPLGQIRSEWWMPLAKDLVQLVLWALAFLGNTVTWHGEQFRVGPGGRLQRVP